MNLTDEQIRMLAGLERDMDSGKQPYVVVGGFRCAFPGDLLAELGIQSGQTVTEIMMMELQRRMIAKAQVEIALKKASDQSRYQPD